MGHTSNWPCIKWAQAQKSHCTSKWATHQIGLSAKRSPCLNAKRSLHIKLTHTSNGPTYWLYLCIKWAHTQMGPCIKWTHPSIISTHQIGLESPESNSYTSWYCREFLIRQITGVQSPGYGDIWPYTCLSNSVYKLCDNVAWESPFFWWIELLPFSLSDQIFMLLMWSKLRKGAGKEILRSERFTRWLVE